MYEEDRKSDQTKVMLDDAAGADTQGRVRDEDELATANDAGDGRNELEMRAKQRNLVVEIS